MSYDTTAMMKWLEASWADHTSSSSTSSSGISGSNSCRTDSRSGGDGSSSSKAQQQQQQQQPAPKAALQELWAELIAELQQLLHSVDSLKHTAEEVIQQQLPLASLQSDSRSSVTDTCGADYGSSGAGSGVGVSSGAGISSGSSGGSSGAGSGDRAADGYAARLPVAKHLKQHMHDVGHDLREVLLPFAQGLAGVFEEHAAFSLPSFADFVFGLEVVGQGLCRAGLPSNSCCSNYVCDNLGTASAMFGLVRGKACVCGACVAASCSSDVDGGSSSASTSGSGGSTAGGLPGRPTPRLLVPARYCSRECQREDGDHH